MRATQLVSTWTVFPSGAMMAPLWLDVVCAYAAGADRNRDYSFLAVLLGTWIGEAPATKKDWANCKA